MMRKRLIYILVLLIVLVAFGAGYLVYSKYDAALNKEAPIINVTFNDDFIEYDVATYEEEVIDNIWYIEKEILLENDEIYVTDKAINSFKLDSNLNYDLTCTLNGELVDVYHDGKLVFKENGLYHFTLDIFSDGMTINNGKYHYEFSVEVALMPKITISNISPVLGELVEVVIDDVDINSTLNIETEFTPSDVLKNDTKRTFYIPITYYKKVMGYPLVININNEVYNYELDVKDYDFSVISFTVSESVSNSTVNSADANKEYREKVHPLYYTRVDEKYWNGPFVKPVEERRISSEFGQKRFINNAKTPKRHSGIDYAADCKTPIYAPNDGLVELAEFLKLSGNTIVIEHGLGLKSYYMHMDDVVVESNTMVKKGDLLGHVGTTGYSTGCHLHFQVSINNQPINPELLYE